MYCVAIYMYCVAISGSYGSAIESFTLYHQVAEIRVGEYYTNVSTHAYK